tara:strand:- start:456 stop:941 length:486 start_codon:yes stop_codon:yes gene_type:complete
MGDKNRVLSIYEGLEKVPFGRKLFTLGICVKSPYFLSIRPKVLSLEAGRMQAEISQRFGIQNHIGSIHALAMGNLVEFVAGVMMEATVPVHMRWIPKGLTMTYNKVAKGKILAEALVDVPEVWENKFDLQVRVRLTDVGGLEVVTACVPMYISPKIRNKIA